MPTAQNKYTQAPQHDCTQVENIVSLQKDVQNHGVRIEIIETKQTKQDDYIGEMKEFRSVQMETNKYLSEIISQNAKLIDKIDNKYEEEIEEIKDQLHQQQIQIITDNQKQDKDYNKDKTALILKVLGWTIAIIGTLVGIVWKFVVK